MRLWIIALFIICVNWGFVFMNHLDMFGEEISPVVRRETDFGTMIWDFLGCLAPSGVVALLIRRFAPGIAAVGFFSTFMGIWGPVSIKRTLSAIQVAIPEIPTVFIDAIFGITTIMVVAAAVQMVVGGWRGLM